MDHRGNISPGPQFQARHASDWLPPSPCWLMGKLHVDRVTWACHLVSANEIGSMAAWSYHIREMWCAASRTAFRLSGPRRDSSVIGAWPLPTKYEGWRPRLGWSYTVYTVLSTRINTGGYSIFEESWDQLVCIYSFTLLPIAMTTTGSRSMLNFYLLSKLFPPWLPIVSAYPAFRTSYEPPHFIQWSTYICG